MTTETAIDPHELRLDLASFDVHAQNGRVDFDACGAVSHVVRPALIPAEWTLEDAQHAIDQVIEPEHCQHAYDCCGRFYGGRAIALGLNYYDRAHQIVWIARTFTQNV